MKKLLILLLIFSQAHATTYYVATTGSDANPGTSALPFKSVGKLSTVLHAGDTAYVHGGTYTSTAGNAGSVHFLIQNLTGTASFPIVIMAYPGEIPVFDCNSITPTYPNPFAMVVANCSYVTVKGFTIKNLKQITDGTGVSRGFMFQNCNNVTAILLNVYNIGGTGVTIDHTTFPSFINCDSHHNGDGRSPDRWNFGDGFTCTGGDPSTDILFDGCRAWMNGDDNWDFFEWAGLKVTIRNCWSFWASIKPWGVLGTQPSDAGMTPDATSALWAGDTSYHTSLVSGEGFKLGGYGPNNVGPVGMPKVCKKFLDHCISFENSGTGYAANMPAINSHQMSLLNCTAYNNDNDGYGFGTGRSVGIAMIFKNDIAGNNNRRESGANWVYDGLATNISNNCWMSWYLGINYGNLYPTVQATDADFVSISSDGVAGSRQADGSLPNLSYLKLKSTSDLIDKGVYVGFPYTGGAPDLGASEYSATNIAPTANAGTDKNIQLPVNSVLLNGTGTDVDGTIAAYLWTKLTGPATFTIVSSTLASTSITGLVAGTYTFELKVTDNAGAIGRDTVQVIVTAANVPPVVNAGVDKIITPPTNSVSVVGTATDADGTIASTLWSRISGGAYAITNATVLSTTFTGLLPGIYKFELKATDNQGAITRDTMQVTVNADPNLPPTANAGADSTITLPVTQTTVIGSGTDADGTIAGYLWTKVSGPSVGVITSTTSATTTITGLSIPGVYLYNLKVTDNSGAVANDTVQITVNPAVAVTPVRSFTITVYSDFSIEIKP